MKKLSFLLILCLLTVLLLPAYAQAAALVLPSGLQQIEAEAFRNDASLETVILPDGVTSIGAYAFAGSGLRSINLPGTIRSIADTAFQNCTGLTASAESGTYAYNWCVSHGIAIDSATPISLGTANVTISTGGQSVRYRFVPTCSGSYTLYSTASLDTLVYLRDAAGNELAYDDDSGENYNFSLTYDFTAGNVYYYEVRFLAADATGSFPVTLSADFGVKITRQPSGVTVVAGQSAAFSLQAEGTGLKYQWQEKAAGSSTWRNISSGSGASGANTISFTAQASQSGNKYRCIVTDGLGLSVTSEEATLYVSASSAPRYRALLIPEVEYAGSQRRPGHGIDADNVAELLRRVKGPDGGTYTVYGGNREYQDSSPTEILDLISSTFAGAKSNDVSLFFISAHGVDSADGGIAGGLGTVRTSPDRSYYTDGYFYDTEDMLVISELAEALKAIPGRVIVMIDSCGSGAGIYASSASVDGADDFDAERFNQEVLQIFADADEGIEEVNAQTGELRVSNKFYVLTSSAHKESTWTTNTGGGPYSKGMLEAVGVSGQMPADVNPADGYLTLREFYQYVYDFTLGYWDDVEQHVQVYPENSTYPLFTR